MATTKTNEQTTQMTQAPQSQPAAMNQSERFTAMVMKEFGTGVGAPELAEYQKRLVQGYFISIDRALKAAEEERLRKNSNNRDPKFNNDLPVTWQNVNLSELATDVVHYARMGLDMMQENHLFPIPYKNNKTQKYDVTLMKGYNGIRYIAEKYALEKPTAVTIELVYSNDTFKPIKKCNGVNVETYAFSIDDPFDRGELRGGFGYIEYADPTKNTLIIMTMKDIQKRKPAYASANFWGGTTTAWENGKKTEKQVEGWLDEMVYKTLVREVYSAKHIARDPLKIDDNYQYMKMREARIAEMEAQADVDMYANGTVIDTTPTALPDAAPAAITTPEVDPGTGEVIEPQEPAATKDGQTIMGGPDF